MGRTRLRRPCRGNLPARIRSASVTSAGRGVSKAQACPAENQLLVRVAPRDVQRLRRVEYLRVVLVASVLMPMRVLPPGLGRLSRRSREVQGDGAFTPAFAQLRYVGVPNV